MEASMSTLRPTLTSLLFITASALLIAQAAPEFDVVSIKRVTELRQTSGFRTLPDGSEVFANISVAGFVRQASPIKVREVINLPEWANTERFDVTVKGPAGATEEQRRAMWGALFADRMKLVA